MQTSYNGGQCRNELVSNSKPLSSRAHYQLWVRTANRDVRLRTDPGVALSCLSPLPVLLMSLWLITGVEGSDEE